MSQRARSTVAVTGFMALLVFLFSQFASALPNSGLSPQGGTVVSVTATSGGGVTIGGTPAKPTVGLLTSCSATQVPVWSGSAWGCGTAGGAGTITGVTAGNGLTGGGTSGTVTLDVACTTGLTCNANDVSLSMTGASCSTNTVMTALGATGTGTCAAPPAFTSGLSGYAPASGGGTTNFLRADGTWAAPSGGGTITGSGTSGKATRWTGTSAIGDASAFDDGTTFTPQALAGTVISPTAITGATNDWNPTGLATATIIRVAVTTSATLSGIVAPSSARVLVLQNIGAGSLILASNTLSTAANRLLAVDAASQQITLPVDTSVVLVYDLTSARWRVASFPALNNIQGASCGAGSFVSTISINGTGSCTAEPGDIAGVTANSPLSGGGTSGTVTVGMANGDRGDISLTTGTQTGDTWTIDNDVVTYAKMQNVSATSRFLGRITAGAGDPEELNGTQATSLLDLFTSTLRGLVPLSGGGTTNFLRADGTWAAPTAGVTGSGTTNTLPMWTSSTALGNSLISQSSNLITLNGSGATGGITESVGSNVWKVNTTAGADALSVNGTQINFHNGTYDSYICYAGGADTYLQSCGTTGVVNIATAGTGGVQIGSSGSVNYIAGDINLSQTGKKTSVKGHIVSGAGAPTDGGCGTSPTIVGSDNAFTVTIGTGSPASCIVSFANSYTNVPVCNVTWRTPTKNFNYTPATGSVTISSSPTSGGVFDVICQDR